MRRIFFFLFLFFVQGIYSFGQPGELVVVNKSASTPVKNQANTGTCWSFSTISLLESEQWRLGIAGIDLSEMYIVRQIYIDKAKNYILRQGAAQFGPGGLGHDVINGISKYGAMPESAYSGLLLGKRSHDHSKLDSKLKSYLDSLLTKRPIPADWLKNFESILDDHLGKVPPTFTYQERTYTPRSFADEFLKFKKEDYVFLTSFTHHPFYEKFILEIPDNYSNESYYNLPLNELLSVVDHAIEGDFSIMWDTDVSNSDFRQADGFAMLQVEKSSKFQPDSPEHPYSQEKRQELFEKLITQDDHLMHIVGMERTEKGKKFYVVKNSWGEIGPYKGYIKVSENYFAINTITLIVPKESIDASVLQQLKLN